MPSSTSILVDPRCFVKFHEDTALLGSAAPHSVINMSLNCAADAGPHEKFVFSARDVSIQLTNFEDSTTIVANGELFLSNERVLFVSSPVTYRVQGKGDREFRSLSVPLVVRDGGIRQSKLVQPWIGPNKWRAIIVPDHSKTFEPYCMWTLHASFNSGGVFDFTSKFGAMASAAATALQEGIAEPLPPYSE